MKKIYKRYVYFYLALAAFGAAFYLINSVTMPHMIEYSTPSALPMDRIVIRGKVNGQWRDMCENRGDSHILCEAPRGLTRYNARIEYRTENGTYVNYGCAVSNGRSIQFGGFVENRFPFIRPPEIRIGEDGRSSCDYKI